MSIEIEKGWRFLSADFSERAAHDNDANGGVLLVRDKESKAAWHRMHKDAYNSAEFTDDGPKLYVYGSGKTIEAAVLSANTAARIAGPIVESSDKEVTA